MRGRTNVMQRPSVTVNGDVVNANVYGTEAIEVGDFVEWNIAYSDEQLFAREYLNNRKVYFNEDIDDNYRVIVCSDGYVDVWNKNTLQLNSSLKLDGVNGFGAVTKLSNNDIVVFYGNYIYYVKYSNGEVSLLNTTNASNLSYPNSVVQLNSNTIGIFGFLAPETSGDPKIFVYTFNSSTGAFTYVTTTSGSVGSTVRPKDNYRRNSKMYYLSNNKILLIYGLYFMVSSSSNSSKVGAAIISFSGSSYTWNLVTSMILNSYYYDFDVVNTSENNFVVLTSTSSSPYYKAYDVKIVNDTLVKEIDGYNIITLIGSTISDSSVNKITLLGLLDDDKILANVSVPISTSNYVSYYLIIEYDETSLSFLIPTFVKVDKSYISSFAYFKNYNDIAVVRSESNGYFYQLHIGYEDDELTGAADKTKAKKYNGGRAIGFAKTGGNVGSEIQIYIPYNS